jgi:hypothetical protein
VKKNTTLDEGLKRQEVGMDEIKKKDGTLGRSFVERERASDRYFCLFFLFASSSIFTVKERLLDSPGAAKRLWNISHLHYFEEGRPVRWKKLDTCCCCCWVPSY